MKKRFMLAIVALVGAFGITGTVAWLARDASLTNTFQAATVGGEILETFDKQTKSEVKVIVDHKETSLPVYIRVALIPTWMDGTHATALQTKNTYEISLNVGDEWIEQEGYYYYKRAVNPGETTSVLVNRCAPNTEGLPNAYKGKSFKLEVITQMVQAEPLEAVKQLWGVDPSKW